ncbi:uncharacterized protein TNIN_389231 [Trichonephila inaurata madagascariensis]|uniref:DUF5641 domain-containing protein n=1 Tax=Trichonephila inaurata madagascariensis TaxID=2747483 RepID=A0A8X6I9C5_9ARAC|nr:uncharacterized protein TNIN_389231 [Trichonephila inaurata madagascariensis]
MKVKACLNQKKAIISSLTRLKNKTLEDINELDSSELKIRKNRFDTIGEELKTIFDNLFSLARDNEIEDYILEKQELFDTWEEMLILLDRRVSHLNKTNKNTEVTHTRNSDSTEIKLPTLSPPTFSGVIDEWLTFSDLFQAAVTNNQNLTGAQKLQYLKGVLKGDAQKIVQSLPITDDNFQIAWDLLKERYFHKREILSSLMKKLMNISPITCESHAQILKLVDSTKECVRLLETLDLKVEGTADIILMFVIQFKLDSTTRGWWERSLDSEKIPSLSELLQFLSSHARSLMTEGYGVKRNISNKKVTLVASGFQLHCSYCQNNHNLNKCDAFQNLSVQKRVNFVKSNNICFICLTQFHRKSACKSTNKCRKCGKSHHTLLHFMTPSEPNSSISRDANNSVLSTSAQVFHPVMSDATNTDTGPNPPNVNNPSTRGLLPSQLLAHDQWIQGPLWLNQPMNEMSSYKIPETFSFPDNALKEKKSVVTCVAKIVPLPEFIDRISSFTNASSHLRKLVELCQQEEVQNFLSVKRIEWSFIPPYTPHFGGLWESAIKSAKQLLLKATNSVLLNFEECSTLLIQIEACLNSRPLTELSPDPSDFNALTPAHFLVGGPIHQFPEPSEPSRSVALSERWNLIQRLRRYFWDRWSTEYLHRLQPRSKWWRTKPNLQLGDMVIVENEQTAPLNWTLGRINKLFFGPDQKVRVVSVNTKYGQLTRNVNKIYLLPNSQEI